MSSNSAAAGRNHQLDGLRGYAAIVVAIFHTILGVDPTQIERVLRVKFQNLGSAYDVLTKMVLTLFNGETAVVIFFVLSGAVLFDSLKRETDSVATSAARFTIRRFLRIYPTLFVCLLACWLAYSLSGIVVEPESFMANALLYGFAVNGASWTLQVELLAVPLLLATFYAYRRFGDTGLWAVGIAIFLLLKLPGLKEYLFYLKHGWICFVFGMALTTTLGERVVRLLPTHSWPVLLIATIFLPSKFQPAAAALLVGVLYYGGAGALGRFLEKPVSRFFGSISYSFYLFNVLFLEIICHTLRSNPWAVSHPLEVGLAASLIVIGLTLPVAYASLHLLENPSIQLGRKLTAFTRSQAAVAPR